MNYFHICFLNTKMFAKARLAFTLSKILLFLSKHLKQLDETSIVFSDNSDHKINVRMTFKGVVFDKPIQLVQVHIGE